MTTIAFFLTALLLATTPTFAQAGQTPAPAPAPVQVAEPDYPIIRLGVLSYVQFDQEFENRDFFSAFDVTRMYLNVNGQMSKRTRFRFTPDIRRITDGSLSGSLILRVKYAFVELDQVKAPGSWIRFGAHQTPWLDFEESIDRYRVQGTMFTEREGLIPGSSDLGLGYYSPFGKFLEIQTGVYNGEGYALPEVNRFKSVQGRMTVRPLAGRGILNGLRISGFYSDGWYAAHRPRRLGIVMGSFEQTHVVVTAQAVAATENPLALQSNMDRRGASGFIEVRQGLAGWAGLARYDHFDPDRALTNNSQHRIIAGGAYWIVRPRSRFAFVATDEQVHFAAGAGRAEENRLLVQTLVEF